MVATLLRVGTIASGYAAYLFISSVYYVPAPGSFDSCEASYGFIS